MLETFKDLCGILTATHNVSLEEMKWVISEQAQEKIINAVDSFSSGWQEIQQGQYESIEHLWDDKP
jgi:hypothetical protein